MKYDDESVDEERDDEHVTRLLMRRRLPTMLLVRRVLAQRLEVRGMLPAMLQGGCFNAQNLFGALYYEGRSLFAFFKDNLTQKIKTTLPQNLRQRHPKYEDDFTKKDDLIQYMNMT